LIICPHTTPAGSLKFAPDIILITGDAYVDHPSFGVAVIARVLENAGFSVALIDQPDFINPASVQIYGEPNLFFGITGGNVDSMLNRFTSFMKIRNDDPFSAGGVPRNRPERAVITYSNLVRSFSKKPIVLGGIEASMRRFAHFDFVSQKIRRSIIEDSRAEILVYGMGEKPVVQIARRLKSGEVLDGIEGTVVIRPSPPEEAFELLSEEEAMACADSYEKFFMQLYTGQSGVLVQRAANRYLVQYPRPGYSGAEMDSFFALPYSRKVLAQYGDSVPAFEMIKNSITSHRGCVSGCAFCSIAMHQGRAVVSRSEESICREVLEIAQAAEFKGHITDIGGATANMYGTGCAAEWRCSRTECLFPAICPNLRLDTRRWLALLAHAKSLSPQIHHVTIGSGIRFDIFMKDFAEGLKDFVINHVSGIVKTAPEHFAAPVLDAMRKKHLYSFEEFVSRVKKISPSTPVLPYLMSNHPGCSIEQMRDMSAKLRQLLGYLPKQVQSFIPLPLTVSSVMYMTGRNPFTGEKIFVERTKEGRLRQHECFFGSPDADTHKNRSRGDTGNIAKKRRR